MPDTTSRTRSIADVLVLAMVVILGPFTIDLNLPAFPEMQRAFSASPSAIQLTLTGTTLGFAMGQLVVGPLSDSLGRRRPLLVMLAAHVVASVAAGLAPSLPALAALRFLQGCAVTATGVVIFAIVRDRFSGRALVRRLADVMVVVGVAPILAPVVGSQLLRFTDWRGLLLLVGAYAAVAWVVVLFRIPETLPPARRRRLTAREVAGRYVALLGDRRFRFVLLVSAMVWAGLFAYLSGSPFLLQNTYALSPQLYGAVFAGNAVLSVAAGQTTSRLVLPRIGPERMLGISTALMIVGATVLLVGGLTGGGIGWVLAGFPVFLIGTGTALPSAQLLGLRDHAEAAGTAASLLGATNFAAAGLVSPLAGAIGAGAALPLAIVLGVAGVLGAAGAVRLRGMPGPEGGLEPAA